MVGTRKGQDVHGNTVGLEAAKIRQLKKLGDYKFIDAFSSCKPVYVNMCN